MVDASGENLSHVFFRRYVQAPQFRKYYAKLANAEWIAEGADQPRRIVYAFVDPNCPYCWNFWRLAHIAYPRGVQVRYIVVGVLGGSSPAKAAAILAAQKPKLAFEQNEEGFRGHSGAIAPAKHISAQIRRTLADHDALMRHFGFDGTPGIVWMTDSGEIRTVDGLPPMSELAMIFDLDPSDFAPPGG